MGHERSSAKEDPQAPWGVASRTINGSGAPLLVPTDFRSPLVEIGAQRPHPGSPIQAQARCGRQGGSAGLPAGVGPLGCAMGKVSRETWSPELARSASK